VSVEDDTETAKTVFIEKKDLRGTVRIHTETEAGDDLPGVSVRLASDDTGYDRERETSSSGYIIFSDVPVGNYQAYLERDGFTSRQTSLTVRDGKTTERGIIMREGELDGRALQVTEIVLPSRVRPGDTATAEVTVRNNKNETARGVRIELQAFEQNTETARFTLAPDESATRSIDINVPESATEDEELRITARGYENTHTIRTTLEMTRFRASMQLEPETATIGGSVYVSGRITDQNGGAGGVVANLYLNEAFIAGLTTDETGRYRTYVRPDSTGIHRLTLKNSNLRVSTTLRVQPRVGITDLTSPAEVNQTAAAKACAQIRVTTDSYVTGTLTFNGRQVAANTTQLSDGQICLPIPTEAAGQYTFAFHAKTRDDEDTEQGSITILPDNQVSNPGISLDANTSFSMDQGQERYLTARLVNPTQDPHNVTIHLRDLPADLSPVTDEEVALGANSTATVNMTITGNRSGSYVGSFDIDYQNDTILSQDLEVDVRGSVEATADSLLQEAERYGGKAFTRVRNNMEYAAAAVLIIAFLILIRRRMGSKMPGPLEPKNA